MITVFDGEGTVARAALTSIRDGRAEAEIVAREHRSRPRPRLVVYQGAAKAGKLDTVVERLAELGVAELWSFSSTRAVVRWDEGKLARLDERWAALARSAAKQSRDPYVMTTGAGLSWPDLLERVSKEPMAITLWENASLPLRAALHGTPDRLALVIGPEGGLSEDEAEALADAGAPLVSLGPRILRTENAALVAASALFFHHGTIG